MLAAARVPVTWDEQHISKEVDKRTNSMVTRENLDSVLVGALLILFWHMSRNNLAHVIRRSTRSGSR